MNMVLKFNRKTLWVCVFAIVIFAIVIAVCLRAEDITGNWQGTITPPQGNPRRMILQVIRDDSGALKARIYSIDQSPEGDRVDSIKVQDSTVTFVVGMLQLSYEGNLSPDGNLITGTWTRGSGVAFNFKKSTQATAWSLPSPSLTASRNTPKSRLPASPSLLCRMMPHSPRTPPTTLQRK
jgi:hypothetical protein